MSIYPQQRLKDFQTLLAYILEKDVARTSSVTCDGYHRVRLRLPFMTPAPFTDYVKKGIDHITFNAGFATAWSDEDDAFAILNIFSSDLAYTLKKISYAPCNHTYKQLQKRIDSLSEFRERR